MRRKNINTVYVTPPSYLHGDQVHSVLFGMDVIQSAGGVPSVAFTTKIWEHTKTVAIPMPSFLKSLSTLSDGETIVITDCQIFGPPLYSCIVQPSFSIRCVYQRYYAEPCFLTRARGVVWKVSHIETASGIVFGAIQLSIGTHPNDRVMAQRIMLYA